MSAVVRLAAWAVREVACRDRERDDCEPVRKMALAANRERDALRARVAELESREKALAHELSRDVVNEKTPQERRVLDAVKAMRPSALRIMRDSTGDGRNVYEAVLAMRESEGS